MGVWIFLKDKNWWIFSFTMKPNRGAFLDILSNWIHLFLHGNLDGVGIIGGIFFFFFLGGGTFLGTKIGAFLFFWVVLFVQKDGWNLVMRNLLLFFLIWWFSELSFHIDHWSLSHVLQQLLMYKLYTYRNHTCRIQFLNLKGNGMRCLQAIPPTGCHVYKVYV